jgi:glycosyltransferase involved in cell wall biosynthesis
MKTIIVGPAHPFRGGIADTNEALSRAIIRKGHQSTILTFSLQYPSFLFPGKTQYTLDPKPKDIEINQLINSINPFNWFKVARNINKRKPDLVIFRYWLPFIAPAFGSIARLLNKNIKTIAITDNVIPHEKRPGDKILSRYFINGCNGFITLSSSVRDELKSFTKKPTTYFPHPINDNLGEKVNKSEAKNYLNLDQEINYILFFGIIRKYKGLDLLLKSMTESDFINRHKIKLLVVGEFYDNPEHYYEMIRNLGIENNVIVKNEFVPTKDIKYYFSAADMVAQTYHTASQSGISQVAYNFECPMLVTNVGGLSEIIPHGKVGYVVEKDPKQIADAINDFYSNSKEEKYIENLKEEKKQYSWDRFVEKMEEFQKKL